MYPEDAVLIVLIRQERDLDRARTEHWYRIPVRSAPRNFQAAQYLAFYLPAQFREEKWTIREYAQVRGHELVRRTDLLPGEMDSPRASDLYYKLELGPVQSLAHPIVSKRGRRLLFVWTTGYKFQRANELNDLLGRGGVDDSIWEAIKSEGLDTERQIIVREGHNRYRVDFLIHCPHGRLGILLRDPVSLRHSPALDLLLLGEPAEGYNLDSAIARIRRQVGDLSQVSIETPQDGNTETKGDI